MPSGGSITNLDQHGEAVTLCFTEEAKPTALVTGGRRATVHVELWAVNGDRKPGENQKTEETLVHRSATLELVAVRPGEGPLTEPTAGAQARRWELVFMPQRSHSPSTVESTAHDLTAAIRCPTASPRTARSGQSSCTSGPRQAGLVTPLDQ